MITLAPGPKVVSDHTPLMLHCKQYPTCPRPPRIEKFWMGYKEFDEVIANAWSHNHNTGTSNPADIFSEKINSMHKDLNSWQKNRFTLLETHSAHCKAFVTFFDSLEELRPLTDFEKFIRCRIKERAYEIANIQELKWHQRSRCKWVQFGDRNTRYFHAFASTRARRKRIAVLKHMGQDITSQQEISDSFFNHYVGLLGTAESNEYVNLSGLYPQRDDLDFLSNPFSHSEIVAAVHGLALNKASGPDGLPNDFCKKHWEMIKPQVFSIFEAFFENNLDLTRVNCANIVLIPKNSNPALIGDFRPISIINFIPKLISKVLSNRLRTIIADLISQKQTAFIPGRFISENFLVTRELLHHVQRSNESAILLKLDFSKAFDTIDWKFLLNVLQARGFPSKFVGWISHLLSSASSKILLNDSQTSSFSHKRGLRQGDPISPLLFNLAVDVLQVMISAANTTLQHSLTSRISEAITAYQYADDTVLVCSTKGNTLRTLLTTLHCFSACSGLRINYHKSVFIPINVSDSDLESIKSLLTCPQGTFPINYLGLPLTTSKPGRVLYLVLIEKIEKRLAGWRGKLISRAGRLQLIKSVLSALPIYYMSCFRLPSWVIARIELILRRFLWSGPDPNVRGVHLLNWNTVKLPMIYGGLGVTDMRIQNDAMLMRWWWRLYTNTDSIWPIMIKAIYGRGDYSRKALILNQAGSFFWQMLQSQRQIFANFTVWEVGNGNTISFWEDHWTGALMCSLVSKRFRRQISLREAKPMIHSLLPAPLSLGQFNASSALHDLTFNEERDKIIWWPSSSGQFSVSSTYKMMISMGKVRSSCKTIWSAKVPPSVRLFFALYLKNRILTQDNLLTRHIHFDPGCSPCDQCDLETSEHLFFRCQYAEAFWQRLQFLVGFPLLVHDECPMQAFLLSLAQVQPSLKGLWLTSYMVAIWRLWRERNSRVFREARIHAVLLAELAHEDIRLFAKYC